MPFQPSPPEQHQLVQPEKDKSNTRLGAPRLIPDLAPPDLATPVATGATVVPVVPVVPVESAR